MLQTDVNIVPSPNNPATPAPMRGPNTRRTSAARMKTAKPKVSKMASRRRFHQGRVSSTS